MTKENSELYVMLKTKEKESLRLKGCAASLGKVRLVQHMCECRAGITLDLSSFFFAAVIDGLTEEARQDSL